jgi:hypothetical protein
MARSHVNGFGQAETLGIPSVAARGGLWQRWQIGDRSLRQPPAAVGGVSDLGRARWSPGAGTLGCLTQRYVNGSGIPRSIMIAACYPSHLPPNLDPRWRVEFYEGNVRRDSAGSAHGLATQIRPPDARQRSPRGLPSRRLTATMANVVGPIAGGQTLGRPVVLRTFE